MPGLIGLVRANRPTGREMHLSKINAVRYVFSLLSKQLLLHEFLAINIEVFHVNSDLSHCQRVRCAGMFLSLNNLKQTWESSDFSLLDSESG